MSRKVCGEGMPSFYADKVLSNSAETYCVSSSIDWLLHFMTLCRPMSDFRFTQDEQGNPQQTECQKKDPSTYFYTPESQSLHRAFYRNDHGIKDAFFTFHMGLLDAIDGNEHVIGVDPMTEPQPSGDSAWHLVQQMWPGTFDKSTLQDLYAKITEIYKDAGRGELLFFEPTQRDQIAFQWFMMW